MIAATSATALSPPRLPSLLQPLLAATRRRRFSTVIAVPPLHAAAVRSDRHPAVAAVTAA
jgi:hypothetical protein